MENSEKQNTSHIEKLTESINARTKANHYGLSLRTLVVFLAMTTATFVQVQNLVASGSLAQAISSNLGGASKQSWLSQIIAIMTCVLAPPVSQIADYWGRKGPITILTFIGGIGCLIISRATSMNMAIAGQGVTGLSYGCQPLLYAVASEVLPRRARPLAQGGLNIAIALAAIFALLVGAVLVKAYSEGFRIFWYITAGFYFLASAICFLLYKPPPGPLRSALTAKEKLRKLDWIGYVLIAVGLTLFSLSLSWSQNPYSWSNPHIIAPFTIGILSIVAFFIYEIQIKQDVAIFGIFVEGVNYFAATEYFTYQIVNLYDSRTLFAGLRFSITFFTAIVASISVSTYAVKTKKLRWPTILAYCCFVIFNSLMASLGLTSTIITWISPIFLGMGLGLCLTCLVTVGQLSPPPELIALSSGLLFSMRSVGGTIGLPIYTALFNSQINQLDKNIRSALIPLGFPERSIPEFISALSARNKTQLQSISGITTTSIETGTEIYQKTYLDAFRNVWIFAAGVSALGIIVSFFMIDPESNLDMHVDAPLEINANEQKFERSSA
ncbi:hypothetical protein N7456_004110 [Penicillium angulare]|uniref:Major facilitator superfamily (MFS) profile domain-containing protein n=1 Tax=Penicillium angulare TaxID=116970 RepID=A0A9W9FWS3_9EURO|nr:hypothetical protein N7456_004110 [Penicillium angulare]